jgi:2-isopropylmalate synthase
MGNKSGCKLNTEQKLVIAEKLDELGVDIIEAGFLFPVPEIFIRLPKFQNW